MSEQTSNPNSGQNVPKSKFRRKSRQEQTAASKLRMERRGEKLDTAREKLAKQKPPKKPGAVKRLAHTAGHGVHGFVHGKLYEVEHENVGTEGAHRSELAAESVYHFGRRKLRKAIREHPAKAVERAENKHIKATADYYYRKTVEEHPEMQEGGAVSRYLQKQKIKRQYAKQAREAAKQTAKAAEGTASVTGKLTEKVSAYIKEHPGGLLLLLAAFLLLVVLQSCMSSLVTVGNGVAGAIGASTYAAEDADLLGAEAAYCVLEDELQRYLDTYTRIHDYDEYRFDLDTIEHDPYVLLSIVCALHEGEWTLDEVRGTLQIERIASIGFAPERILADAVQNCFAVVHGQRRELRAVIERMAANDRGQRQFGGGQRRASLKPVRKVWNRQRFHIVIPDFRDLFPIFHPRLVICALEYGRFAAAGNGQPAMRIKLPFDFAVRDRAAGNRIAGCKRRNAQGEHHAEGEHQSCKFSHFHVLPLLCNRSNGKDDCSGVDVRRSFAGRNFCFVTDCQRLFCANHRERTIHKR